jgi:hypothetical protein
MGYRRVCKALVTLVMLFVSVALALTGLYNINRNLYGDELRHRPPWHGFISRHHLLPMRDWPLKWFVYGDEDALTLEALKMILLSINDEAGLHRVGKALSAVILGELMEQRHCVAQRLKTKVKALGDKQGCAEGDPVCVDSALNKHYSKLPAPVIVLGLPRTATTFMHGLLAEDDVNFRAPRYHEYQQACPEPADETNPKKLFDYARVEFQSLKLNAFRELFFPNMNLVHEMDARAPEEDVVPLGHTGISAIYPTTFLLPSYMKWLQQDSERKLKPAVQYLRRYLDVHLRKDMHRKWLLKTPWHLVHVGELIETFPGVAFVWTHRDIVEQMSSLCTLTLRMYGIGTDKTKAKEFYPYMGQPTVDFWLWVLERGVEARRKLQAEGKARFIDVSFASVRRDPVLVAQRIYERLGLTLSPDTLERFKRHVGNSTGASRIGLQSRPLSIYQVDENALRSRYNEIMGRLTIDFV